MNREEIISNLLYMKHSVKEDTIEDITINEAIKALQQEPCTDAISRQAVDDIIEDVCPIYGNDYRYILRDKVNELPPVTPTEKVGQWINHKCSFCGYGVMPWNDTPYCPNCGEKKQERKE